MRSRWNSWVLLAATLTFGGCGQMIRGAAEALGAEESDSTRADSGDGSIPLGSSVISLIQGAHRTVEGSGPVVVVVVRRKPTAEVVTIDYRSADVPTGDRATAGTDYRPVSGTLTWGPQDWQPQFIQVDVFSDRNLETTELFQIEFSNVQGARSSVESVICYIDDPSTIPVLVSDVETLSVETGGSQRLWLRAGGEHAYRRYLLAGSLSTSPGFDLGGVHIPLNVDPWFEITMNHINSENFHQTSGILDSQGGAFIELRAPPIPIPSLIGTQVYHAAVVYDDLGTFHLASNPVSLTLVQ